MTSWNSFIRREDIESEPGVIDANRVRALTCNTFMESVTEQICAGS